MHPSSVPCGELVLNSSAIADFSVTVIRYHEGNFKAGEAYLGLYSFIERVHGYQGREVWPQAGRPLLVLEAGSSHLEL